jgi:hypothetical protein
MLLRQIEIGLKICAARSNQNCYSKAYLPGSAQQAAIDLRADDRV